ncbi:MAG: zinc-binding dehydrogenase [Aerococcaceae bacterium]|nr:zinc-binding dehydrogenase [Aerococcaceae bacterium]
MKAIKVMQPGSIDVLTLIEVDKPQIKAGWSLVKVKGFGINRSEIFTRQGYSPSVTFPRILGIECVGIIEATSDVTRLPVGSRVVSLMGEMGRAFDGSYAEYVLLPNHQIYKVDSDMAWPEFASIPETYYTAYGSLKNLRLITGDRVLVRGATSGVGVAFAKLLRGQFPDMRLYGSTRNLKKREKLLENGYDTVILDQDGILDTTEKFDKILDLVGPKVIKNSIGHLNEYGIICNTGLLGGSWYLEDFDPIEELRANIYLTAFHSGNVREESLAELFDYMNRYQIRSIPEKVFRLDQIQQAHAYLEESDSFGKVVIINE